MNWFTEHLQNNELWRKIKFNPIKLSQSLWGIIIVFASISVIFKTIREWHQLQNLLWQLDLHYLFISFGIYSVNIILTASCWALIIGHFSGIRTFWRHVGTFCLTNLAQRLPTPLPYISARTEAYTIYGISRKTTLMAMAVEVASTLFSAAVVALVTFLFGAFPYPKEIKLVLWALLLSLALPLLFPRKFLSLVNLVLARLNRSPLPIILSGRYILWPIGIFIIIWLNNGALYYYLISTISSAPEGLLFFLINISAVSGIAGWIGQFLFFVPTPFIRQLTMVYLLSLRFPMSVAVVFVLFFRASVMVFEFVWASFCFLVFVINKRFCGCKNKTNREGL